MSSFAKSGTNAERLAIASEHQLDELMSRPSEADKEAIASLPGDLILLGVGGKMGPTLAVRARWACMEAGIDKRIIGVSRFSDEHTRAFLQQAGVETISADLLDRDAVAALPDAENVLFMAGRKFGSSEDASLTWAMNAYVPALVAERYREARIVAFSTGNVYPLSRCVQGSPTEDSAPDPCGEYGQSALARERMFEFFSRRFRTPCTILRLNYAIDLRYGVLLDIGMKVFERKPVDLRMGSVNVIWQGDANSIALRSFALCSSPPFVLNVTGPETLSVRAIALRFGRLFGVQPEFQGQESDTALLSDAGHCHRLFGYPSVTPEEMIEWIAAWIGMGGRTLNKPTHFETRDGKF